MVLQTIYFCELIALALFLFHFFNVFMSLTPIKLEQCSLKELSALNVLQLRELAKEHKLRFRSRGKTLRRKELIRLLINHRYYLRSSCHNNPFDFNLTQPLLPATLSQPRVQTLFNSSLACLLFDYSSSDIITIKDLRFRLRQKAQKSCQNRLLNIAYKSIKDNILWLEDKNYTPKSLILYGNNNILYASQGVSLDTDLRCHFSKDGRNIEEFSCLGLEEVIDSKNIVEVYGNKIDAASSQLKSSVLVFDQLEEEIAQMLKELDKIPH